MLSTWQARTSVRTQLAILVTAVLLPLAAFISYQILETARAQRAVAMANLQEYSAAVASQAHHLFREADWVLSRLAASPAARDIDRGLCREHAALSEFHREFINLLLFTPQGGVVCSARPAPPGGFQPDGELLAAGLGSEGTHAGNVIPGVLSGQLIVVFTHAVRDASGVPTGLLALTVGLGHFERVLADLGMPPEFSAVLIDRNGTFIARVPAPEEFRGKPGRGVPAVDAALRRETRDLRAQDATGVERVYVAREVAGVGWHAMAGVEASALQAPQRALIAKALLTAAAMLALTLWVALRISRQISAPLERLAAVAVAVRQGDRAARAPVEGLAEVRSVGLEMNRMLEAIAASEGALREAVARLDTLSARLLMVTEQERGEIARELHDQLGQLLTALQYELKAMKWPVSTQQAALGRCLEIADELLDHIRDLTLDLRPAQLDSLGVPAALRAHIERRFRNSGIAVEYSADQQLAVLRPELASALYRIAQEALTNIQRHARPRRIEVSLRREGSEACLRVRDDGVGFDPKSPREGTHGLRGMQDRALLAGGALAIRSSPGGTEIELRAPLEVVAQPRAAA